MKVEFNIPDLTVIVRWTLRVVLFFFLGWLVFRRQGQDDDDEDDANEEEDKDWRSNRNANRPGARGGMQPSGRRAPYDPYQQNSLRNRGGRFGEQNSCDFDAVIAKMSKPKQMWEVNKSPGQRPQIFKRSDSGPDGTPTARSGGNPARNKDPAKRPQENMLQGHERPVTCITINRDGNLLFTCAKDKRVCVWSFPDGDCLGSYDGHNGAVWGCSVTASSKWLVTCGADRLVIVWEARTSTSVARVELPGVAKGVEWALLNDGDAGESDDAPKQERFVTCHNKFGSQPAALTIWRFDGDTAIEEVSRITDLPTAATYVRWGKKDETLVSAHENGELHFWCAATGAALRQLKAHDSLLNKFDFSSDRELVATASADMVVKLWDLGEGSEGTLLFQTKTDRPLNTVALGPITRSDVVGPAADRPERCTVIAAGGQDVRDVTTTSSTTDQFENLMFRLSTEDTVPGELQGMGTMKGHFGPVHTLAFTADGGAFASGSEDGCVRIHSFDAKAPEA